MEGKPLLLSIFSIVVDQKFRDESLSEDGKRPEGSSRC